MSWHGDLMSQNKTQPRLHFKADEFANRLQKTRMAMQAAHIDTLIVCDPANMNWLTGYDGWSFYVHQCVVVSLRDDLFWFGRGIDANGARLRTYLNHSDIIDYPDHYVMSNDCHPMEFLAQVLKDRGLSAGNIGVELDNYYYSAAAHQALDHNLPNAKLLDCQNLVNWQRAIKSPQELEYMAKAGKIVEAMHQRIRQTIKPGLPKNQLVAQIYDASLCGVEGIGGDYPAIVPLLPSGVEASACHLTWDERPLQKDQGTFFEIAGCYRRYHCPLSRTAFIGKPPQKFLDAQKAVLEGLDAGLEQAKPGKTCHDVASAFFAVLERHDIHKSNRTGYPIGLAYPPDWGEHTMSLRPGDHSVLEPGMTFHFMPGLWMDDWGIEITESIVITDNGAKCLSNVPREIFVVD